jgi:predicted DsbA family dithiol-disulfide isomerase
MAPMPETVAVYFDYLCPYAWRGAEVAEMVAGALGLRFEWHHFSLIQSDREAAGQGGELWNERLEPDDATGGFGLRPFLASCAARRQGPEAFDRFRLGLMRARHRDGAPFTEATLFAVAERAELHLARFERDLADPELRTCLAQEHHRAAARDVFGTPTFAFPDGSLAYLRVRELPFDGDEAVRLFRAYRELLEAFPYLETVRRPRPKRN